jgi:hypothetical protein
MKDETKKRDRDGAFEKVRGSGVWWINYRDAQGRGRREKVGSKSAAIKLVEKRRTEARQGVKLPENLRTKPITFSQLAERCLLHSRANKKSFGHDEQRMKHLLEAFGNRAAEEITPDDIDRWLDSKAEDWAPATRNRHLALMKLAYNLAERGRVIKVFRPGS